MPATVMLSAQALEPAFSTRRRQLIPKVRRPRSRRYPEWRSARQPAGDERSAMTQADSDLSANPRPRPGDAMSSTPRRRLGAHLQLALQSRAQPVSAPGAAASAPRLAEALGGAPGHSLRSSGAWPRCRQRTSNTPAAGVGFASRLWARLSAGERVGPQRDLAGPRTANAPPVATPPG